MFSHVIKHKYKFDYLMKCDDDTFVDVPRIASELHQRNHKGLLYWGEMVRGPVLTSGIFEETHWSACSDYFPYAFGGGYVLSRDLVELIVDNRHLKIYLSEDVSVSAWLAALNIERRHDSRYNKESKSRRCKSVYLVTHKVSPKRIFSLIRSLTEEGRICGKRTRWNKLNYQGYLYN